MVEKLEHQEVESTFEERMVKNLVKIEKTKSIAKAKGITRYTNEDVQASLEFLNNFTAWLLTSYLNRTQDRGTLVTLSETGKATGNLNSWSIHDEKDRKRLKNMIKALEAINRAIENTSKPKEIRDRGLGKYEQAARQLEKLFADDKLCGDFVRTKTGDAFHRSIYVLKSKKPK